MGMNRFKKLVRNTLKIHKLAESASKFAESFKGQSVYEMLRENADDILREFEVSLKKADREYKSNLRVHQTSSKGFISWILKNGCIVVNQKNNTVVQMYDVPH